MERETQLGDINIRARYVIIVITVLPGGGRGRPSVCTSFRDLNFQRTCARICRRGSLARLIVSPFCTELSFAHLPISPPEHFLHIPDTRALRKEDQRTGYQIQRTTRLNRDVSLGAIILDHLDRFLTSRASDETCRSSSKIKIRQDAICLYKSKYLNNTCSQAVQ